MTPTTAGLRSRGKALGEGYHVIEGGFNGRSTIYDDPSAYGRNGETTLVHSLKRKMRRWTWSASCWYQRPGPQQDHHGGRPAHGHFAAHRHHPAASGVRPGGVCPKILLMAPTEVVPRTPRAALACMPSSGAILAEYWPSVQGCVQQDRQGAGLLLPECGGLRPPRPLPTGFTWIRIPR